MVQCQFKTSLSTSCMEGYITLQMMEVQSLGSKCMPIFHTLYFYIYFVPSCFHGNISKYFNSNWVLQSKLSYCTSSVTAFASMLVFCLYFIELGEIVSLFFATINHLFATISGWQSWPATQCTTTHQKTIGYKITHMRFLWNGSTCSPILY